MSEHIDRLCGDLRIQLLGVYHSRVRQKASIIGRPTNEVFAREPDITSPPVVAGGHLMTLPRVTKTNKPEPKSTQGVRTGKIMDPSMGNRCTCRKISAGSEM
jgi:hypothetical protein